VKLSQDQTKIFLSTRGETLTYRKSPFDQQLLLLLLSLYSFLSTERNFLFGTISPTGTLTDQIFWNILEDNKTLDIYAAIG
jgi:hypothetical protein